jgi:hypothetical protein
MARPRKTIAKPNGRNTFETKLVKIPAKTAEEIDRLREATELVIHFIGLGRTKKRPSKGKEETSHAA